jgi:Mg-chelatase subunit ChlD
VGLVLVLDRSGSMMGEKFENAKQACLSAVGALKKDDSVGIVLFDSAAQVLVEPGGAARPEIGEAVRRMQPGGGTDIKSGLEAAAQMIPEGPVRFRILLMSDGMAPTEGLVELVRDLRNRGITLSAVALGGEADRALLRTLAATGGGTFHDVELPPGLETVFVQEANDRSRAR